MKRALILLLLCAPAWSANDFSADPNVLALMNFDIADEDNPSLGYWHDSSGNDQDFSGDVDSNTVDFQQGDGCAEFDCMGKYAVGNYINRADVDLSADWPIKQTFAGTVKFSFCAWFKPDLLPTSTTGDQIRALFGKYNSNAGERGIALTEFWDDSKACLRFYKGWDSGGSQELTLHTTALVSGQWYHIGLTYDDTDHSVVMRLWDETAGTVTAVTDTHTNAMDPNGCSKPVYIGQLQLTAGQYYEFDGLMDEMVFFNDILTADEIDEIRLGTYGAPAATGTSNWWWRRRHNN